MKFGIIGCGNMGAALARGLMRQAGNELVLFDPDRARSEALSVDYPNAVVVDTSAALAAAAEAVVLCHKPVLLDVVAKQVGDVGGKPLLSVLAGVEIAALEAAFPGSPVVRLMPNIAVEIGTGVVCLTPSASVTSELRSKIDVAFASLGKVIEINESQFGAATAVGGVGPAYVALFAEAWVESAIRHGLPAPLAEQLVFATIAGSAAMLEQGDLATLEIRRNVASPGGVTARGLAELEHHGLREALAAATDAVVP